MKLSTARKKAGLTQEQLAEKIGVSRGLIGQVECDARRAYPLLRKRIAEVLQLPETKIFK